MLTLLVIDRPSVGYLNVFYVYIFLLRHIFWWHGSVILKRGTRSAFLPNLRIIGVLVNRVLWWVLFEEHEYVLIVLNLIDQRFLHLSRHLLPRFLKSLLFFSDDIVNFTLALDCWCFLFILFKRCRPGCLLNSEFIQNAIPLAIILDLSIIDNAFLATGISRYFRTFLLLIFFLSLVVDEWFIWVDYFAPSFDFILYERSLFKLIQLFLLKSHLFIGGQLIIIKFLCFNPLPAITCQLRGIDVKRLLLFVLSLHYWYLRFYLLQELCEVLVFKFLEQLLI